MTELRNRRRGTPLAFTQVTWVMSLSFLLFPRLAPVLALSLLHVTRIVALPFALLYTETPLPSVLVEATPPTLVILLATAKPLL